MRSSSILFACFALSVGSHIALTLALPRAPARTVLAAKRAPVSFELRSEPLVKAEPIAPRPVLEKERIAVAHAVPTAASQPTTEATPEPNAAPRTLDMTGVTLTSDGNSGWSAPSGNGVASLGPIGTGVQSPRASDDTPSPRVEKPRRPPLVALADLAQKPHPPALDANLERNYPESARATGLEGSASVLARVDADGVVRNVRVRSESAPGFGAACQRTLLGSKWSPPVDRSGERVATEVAYGCHFRVTR